MEIGQGAEGGFDGDAFAVYQAEVGVVEDDKNGFSGLGGFVNRLCKGLGFINRGGVAGGIVGEVEQEDFFCCPGRLRRG